MPYSSFRDYIEQVRTASPIEDVVEQYVDVGSDSMALCPLHKESTPSFHVNVEDQYFYCFGCSQGGDVFRFIGLVEGKGFSDAVAYLAAEAGLERYRPTAADQTAVEVVDERTQAEAIELFCRFYEDHQSPKVSQYLTSNRKLPEAFIKQYRIGWGAPGIEPLAEKMNLAFAARDAGLLDRHANALPGDPEFTAVLTNRVIFPVLSKGQPVFLSGRAFLPGHEPKYLHQRGHEAPMYEAGPPSKTDAYVVEGIIDALSLAAWGLPAKALQGGMRGSAVVKLGQIPNVYAVLDADAAGRRSVMALARALLRTRARVQVVILPMGEDPNDYYRKGTKEEFEYFVRSAVSPLWYAFATIDPTQERHAIMEALGPVLDFLAEHDPMVATAAINSTMKERFDFTREEVKAVHQSLILRQQHALVRCSNCGAALTKRSTT